MVVAIIASALLCPLFAVLLIRAHLLLKKANAQLSALSGLAGELREVKSHRDRLSMQLSRFDHVIDIDVEHDRVKTEIARLVVAAEHERAERARSASSAYDDLKTRIAVSSVEATNLRKEIARLSLERSVLEEESVLRSLGFYKPLYNFASSDKYEGRLERIREEQKEMLKSKSAASCAIEWEVNGSKTEGRKQINHTIKLMLRAFNGECDAAIAKVNYKNVKAMESRVEKSAETIEALVVVQQCSLSRQYVALKLDELHLVHEFEEKLQQEKEEQRRIREQMRDEEVARRELEKAKADAEREERRCEDALLKARQEVQLAQGAQHDRLAAKIAELESRLSEVQARERAISQAQLTRAGHVYVISNVGSFGEDVFKIGMTRRLVPQDRIDELGDASVPFEFDVHAIISTADAPALECALHQALEGRRVNRVNARKEFFRVSLEQIEQIVRQHHGGVELTRVAEAPDYRKTLALVEEERRNPPAADRPAMSSDRAEAVVH